MAGAAMAGSSAEPGRPSVGAQHGGRLKNPAPHRPALARLLAAGALAGALACTPAHQPPTLSVHLAGSTGDFQEVNLQVREVQVRGQDSGWVTLGRPEVTVNLLGLTDGVAALLADGAELSPGAYGQLRLVLGRGASVRLRDGSVHPLLLPALLRDGLDLEVDLAVRPGSRRAVFVDLDVGRSVRRSGQGAATRFVLVPVVHAVDRAVARKGGGVRLGGGQG